MERCYKYPGCSKFLSSDVFGVPVCLSLTRYLFRFLSLSFPALGRPQNNSSLECHSLPQTRTHDERTRTPTLNRTPSNYTRVMPNYTYLCMIHDNTTHPHFRAVLALRAVLCLLFTSCSNYNIYLTSQVRGPSPPPPPQLLCSTTLYPRNRHAPASQTRCGAPRDSRRSISPSPTRQVSQYSSGSISWSKATVT